MVDNLLEVIRPTADQWPLFREIRLRSLADAPEAYGSTLPREQAFTEADWRERMGSSPVLVLDGERPVAMGAAWRDQPGWVMVVGMWTDPAYRGRGLAGQVLDALVEAAHAEELRVYLWVTQGNSAARSAYQRYGFVATGEAEPKSPDRPHLLMDKMVLPPPG
ncbi:GNAT family N-acetyltransferase [Nocardioides speluncae]|uniref:GNAT family N-acetyltransferase n=1 Tax=Nocardioides speluncae TaxID=2670337 RepID=UPI000D6867AA|nr:GNAT family N-acetyltransferase [Nocardioides speluncae]